MSGVIFEPMPGKIAVETDDRSEFYRSGLVVLRDPSNSKIGRVVAIYEPFNLHQERPEEMTEAYVKVGDLVVFGRHSGVEVTVDRVKVTILKETEILTKVKLPEEYDKKQQGLSV